LFIFGGFMKKLLLVLGSLLLFANLAIAGIPVAPGYYIGFRTTPPGSGIDSTGGYLEENGGYRISWEISFDGSYWNYAYTLTDKDGSPISPDTSHWIVEISEEVDFENIGDYVFDANATVVTPPAGEFWPEDPDFPIETKAGSNNGNPNLGTELVGIKFDNSASSVGGTYTFKSVEPPVWGDFYVK
jgi:hypothetical protein